VLTSLCKRYVEAKNNPKADKAYVRKLREEVMNADMILRLLDRIGTVAVAAPILYCRQRLNSVEVAAQLRMNPTGVRANRSGSSAVIVSNSTLRTGLARLPVSDTDRYPNRGILSVMAILRQPCAGL
jgi:hypothetical protein